MSSLAAVIDSQSSSTTDPQHDTASEAAAPRALARYYRERARAPLADPVGAGAFAVRPIFELIEGYVLSAVETNRAIPHM